MVEPDGVGLHYLIPIPRVGRRRAQLEILVAPMQMKSASSMTFFLQMRKSHPPKTSLFPNQCQLADCDDRLYP
jgi:hypothetical protein